MAWVGYSPGPQNNAGIEKPLPAVIFNVDVLLHEAHILKVCVILTDSLKTFKMGVDDN